jgi:hypothetical protein
LSERDAAHGAAHRWQAAGGLLEVVTTSWVLVELADLMSRDHRSKQSISISAAALSVRKGSHEGTKKEKRCQRDPSLCLRAFV